VFFAVVACRGGVGMGIVRRRPRVGRDRHRWFFREEGEGGGSAVAAETVRTPD